MHTPHIDPRLQNTRSTCDRCHPGQDPISRFAISGNGGDQRDRSLRRLVSFGIEAEGFQAQGLRRITPRKIVAGIQLIGIIDRKGNEVFGLIIPPAHGVDLQPELVRDREHRGAQLVIVL